MLIRNQFLKYFSVGIFLLGQVYAQQNAEIPPKDQDDWFTKNFVAPQTAYIHLGLGRGMSIASSNDIENVITPFKIYPLSFDKSFNLLLGYKNILQIEFRSNKSNHDFHDTEPTFQGGQITRTGTEIEMEIAFKEWLFKVNPFFSTTNPRVAIFFVYGIGDVNNVDAVGDGFKNGVNSIYGLDISYIVRYISASAALEYRNITFKRFELQDFGTLEQDFGMGYFIINLKLSVGWGM